MAKNNLAKGRFSSFLPEAYVVLENDFRSLCPVLKDFRARLRQATEEQVPAFIEEGRKLFTARAPFDTCIVLSHAKRLKICKETDRAWRRENPHISNRIVRCEDLGSFALYVGLSLKALHSGTLTKGMWYKCVCLDPIELEEETLRWGEEEKRIVTISEEALAREATLSCAVTAASVQGDEKDRVCIADLDNKHMRKKDILEMCAGRARTAANLRFL